MTKRIFSLVLAVLTVFSLCVPALASAGPAEDIPSVETPAEDAPAAGPEATVTPEAEAIPGPEAADGPETAQAGSVDEPEVTALSGTCGQNGSTSVKWKLTANGTNRYGKTTYTITISGKGRMEDFYAPEGVADTPWLRYKNDITKIIVQNGVTSIGDNAFYLSGQSYGLSSVTLPDTLVEIGECAFAYFGKLQSITIPDSVKYIGEYAFWSTDLRSVKLPSSLKAISDLTFCDCDHLSSVVIPDGVTSIGDHAFLDCTSLKSVTIPGSVTKIGANAFARCENLTSLTVLNKSCDIDLTRTDYAYWYDYALGVPGVTVIHGYKGSTAEAYVKKWSNFDFVSLGTAPADRNGWVTENGKKYYYQNGAKVKGLKTISGAKYYFSSKDGAMLTGLVRVDSEGHLCYFSAKTGKMLTGIVTVDSAGHKCYFSAKNGYRLTGVVTVDNAGHKCYFSAKTGFRLTGLVTTDPKGTQRYFSVKNGYMLKDGWYNIGDGRKALIDARGVVTKIVK